MYPLKLEPILKQTLWGGDKIIAFKQLNETLSGVGESWEISAVEDNESVVAMGLTKALRSLRWWENTVMNLSVKRITLVLAQSFPC